MKRGTQVKFLSTKGYLPAIVLDNIWDFGYINLLVFDGDYHCVEIGIEKGNDVNQWTYANWNEKIDLSSKKEILKYYGVLNDQPKEKANQDLKLKVKLEIEPEGIEPEMVISKQELKQISFW